MSERLNRSRYIILGFLSIGEASGYEIKRMISNSISHFCSESKVTGLPQPNLLKKIESIALAFVKMG